MRSRTSSWRSGRTRLAVGVAVLAAGMLSAWALGGAPGVARSAGQPCVPAESVVPFTGDHGAPLVGTLTVPCAVRGPTAGVLLLAGSGPTDRDGNQPDSNLTPNTLRDLAAALAARGVASLRYDKRGVGASRAGVPTDRDAWPAFFAWRRFRGDVIRALAVLAAQPQVDRERLAVLGHSEGGLLALDATAHVSPRARPEAIALLATPGRPLQTVVDEQLAQQLARSGAAKAHVRRVLRVVDAIWEQIKRTGRVPATVPSDLQALFPSYAGPFLQQEMRLHPDQLARRHSGPVLVVNGMQDHQVSADRDARALAQALATRHPDRHTLWLIAHAGHGLDQASADPDTPVGAMRPEVARRIARWVAARLTARG